MKKLVGLMAALVLLAHAGAYADSDTDMISDHRGIIEDRVATATVGYEHLFKYGKDSDRMLLEMEFYGFQKDGRPNRKSRFFWVEARAALNTADKSPEMIELNLIPYTYSKNNDGEEEDESHHQFAALQFMRDISMGINRGIRLRPYLYKRAHTEDNFGKFYGSFDLLGYALEEQVLKNGKSIWQHYLHVASLNGGVRFQIRSTPRTNLTGDFIRVGMGVKIPLNDTDHHSSGVAEGSIETGLTLDLYKKDMRKRLGQLRLYGGARGHLAARPTRDENGNSIPEDQRGDLNNLERGYGYITTNFTLYFE